MKINATQFKNNFGEYIQKVNKEPVIIEKSGKPAAVLISYETFEKLSDLEDFYWGMKAHQAACDGFLGPEESEKRLMEHAKIVGIKIYEERNES